MNIIKRATLEAFWKEHPDAEGALKEWFHTVRTAGWQSMADIKATYPKASVINSERVVFNICGGHYRLIVAFKFTANIAFIKFVGTHQEYDKVKAASVNQH